MTILNMTRWLDGVKGVLPGYQREIKVLQKCAFPIFLSHNQAIISNIKYDAKHNLNFHAPKKMSCPVLTGLQDIFSTSVQATYGNGTTMKS